MVCIDRPGWPVPGINGATLHFEKNLWAYKKLSCDTGDNRAYSDDIPGAVLGLIGGITMKMSEMMHVVSKFRSAMANNGYKISFPDAAKILIDANIVKQIAHAPGYVLSDEIAAEVRRLHSLMLTGR